MISSSIKEEPHTDQGISHATLNKVKTKEIINIIQLIRYKVKKRKSRAFRNQTLDHNMSQRITSTIEAKPEYKDYLRDMRTQR